MDEEHFVVYESSIGYISIVMKNGKVTEIGTHLELVKKRGDYFELVKNQLELGN